MISIRMVISMMVFASIIGCSRNSANTFEVEQAIELDTLSGTAPYLTKDNNGHIVISWARAINDSVSEFCYAVSQDNGKTFGKPIAIPGSTNLQAHSENLPKIIFKSSGETIALWGAANPNPNNKYSGLVFYSSSTDKGVSWTVPTPLVTDTGSYDQRYYDVALLPTGEAAIIWLDNRKTTTKEGSSLYFARTQGDSGFQNEKKITEQCCQCCRTDLFVDSKSGIHVIYRGIIQDSIRDMLHSVSVDGGQTFSTPNLISDDRWILKGCPHTGPAMTENKNGLHFAWYTGGNKKGCYYNQSQDNGKSFVKQERVSEMGSHPQITTDSKDRLILVWDESFKSGNDFSRKIGVQLRSPEGAEILKQYISSDEEDASFPVVMPIGDQSALVAFTIKKDKHAYINCKRVSY